ncbi:MAG TPA: transposase, partial [Gallicola sp.]|nr:transposase [Gallicola sp.]
MYKTKEQKIQAVADFKKQDLSVQEYAKQIGVHMSTMYNWLKLYGDEAEKLEEEKPEEGWQANNVEEKEEFKQEEEETREEKNETFKEESLENPLNSEGEEVIIKDRIDNLQATGSFEPETEVLETKEEKKNVNLELNKVLLVAGAIGGLALIVFVLSKRNNQPKQAVKFQPQIFQGGNVNA